VTIFREEYIKNTMKITEGIRINTVLKEKIINIINTGC
jgi:hypothetical protein